MLKITVQVDGMVCGMCEAHVNDAVRKAFPVKKVASSHSKGETVILTEIDIAEELGISTATVSNVIHGKTKKISARTVKRVQEKLEERGYIPNMAATLLAQNDSRIIGVVINDHPKYEGQLLTDPFVAASLNNLSDEIEGNGYFMMIKKAKNIIEAVKFASMWNMDGMVILGFCASEYQGLRDRIHIPFVVYDGYFKNEGRICNIQIDDRDGGRQVGAHLHSLGHQKVLCISDNRQCMDLQRYLGLCDGLGTQADFLEIPMQKKEREAFFRERLAWMRQYSAVFAVSDYYALDLMRFLQASGTKVPEDISIVGFDDGAVCEQVVPSLTSVRQDGAHRARMALQMLKRMRQEPDYFGDFLVSVQLIPRDSTRRLCD